MVQLIFESVTCRMLYISILTGLVATASCWTQLSLAAASVWARFGERTTGDLESFIASENRIALQGVLNNIGSMGSKAMDAYPGLVVASPSIMDPDCKSPHLYACGLLLLCTFARKCLVR